MEIRRLCDDQDIQEALDLAENVFSACNAASYTQVGVDSFYSCLTMFRIFPILEYWGCYLDGRLVGMLGNSETQLTLLFVHPDFQGKGIGRALVQDRGTTVKAFPGSVDFYCKMGFKAISEPQNEDGIEYVMMERM